MKTEARKKKHEEIQEARAIQKAISDDLAQKRQQVISLESWRILFFCQGGIRLLLIYPVHTFGAKLMELWGSFLGDFQSEPGNLHPL